jgi:PIN domain nuclease of toxin-antitoxin system
MNLLLDTHIAIWTTEDNSRLSDKARRLIVDPEANVFVSVVSVWEIAIKHALKRGGVSMPVSGQQAVERFKVSGFELLPVSLAHTLAVESLAAHHDDPFDRLIVATAMCDQLCLITHDARLADYGCDVRLV